MLLSGAKVVLWDIDAKALAAAKEALSALGTVDGAAVELTDDAAVNAATGAVMRAHGRIDILVNNAGITGGNATTWELQPEVWRRVVEVNLIAPYLTCRAVVPQMLQRGYGRIVNVARWRAGRQPERLAPQRLEGRADRAHQVARQGTGDAGACW